MGWLASACAFTDVPLALPTSGFESPAEGGDGREVIVVIPFSDARETRDRCGMQKNGYNADTAYALCQSVPTVWIATLLADELRTAGFTVLQEGADHRPGALRIDGTLIKLSVEPVLGMRSGSLEADLSVARRATTATGLAAERTFFVKRWKAGVLASTAQPIHTALHRGTQALPDEMVRAVTEMLDRYPAHRRLHLASRRDRT